MNLTVEKINKLLGINESYQASERLMKILFNKEYRENLFKQFLAIDCDLDSDWFHEYFQDEHADRKNKKQDFTPNSVSTILSELVGGSAGNNLDVAAGTGGLTIRKWVADKYSTNFFKYRPSMFFYNCEELSDRAVPFLLFNLLIRGMNATVVHGDTLTRKIKQVYFIQNFEDDFLHFSDLNVMPHSQIVAEEFSVNEWLEEEIKHIESVDFPKFLEMHIK